MLGGGKTYNATIRAVAHIASGGHVYSNVIFHPEAIDKYILRQYGVIVNSSELIHYLTTEQMREFPKHIARGNDEHNVLLIADEAHLLWGNMEWAKVGTDILQFITLSRKFGVHIVIITQHIDNVAKQFRRLIQFYWTFRDIRKLRVPVLHLKLSFLPLLQMICIDSFSKEPLRNELTMLDKDIFPLYDTRQIVLPMSLLDQTKVTSRKATWAERYPRLARKHMGLMNAEVFAISCAILFSFVDIFV